MVELSTASSGDDTTGVIVKDGLVGLDGDRNWSLGNSSLELGGGSDSDILETSNLTNTLSLGVLAGSIFSGVWVG